VWEKKKEEERKRWSAVCHDYGLLF
jgi:hypothetical protein